MVDFHSMLHIGDKVTVRPGWRTFIFEAIVIVMLLAVLYTSWTDKQKMYKVMMQAVDSSSEAVELLPNESEIKQKITMAVEITDLHNIQAPVDWTTLGRAMFGLESSCSQTNSDGTLKLNKKSKAMGFGQILPNKRERKCLAEGRPVVRNGLDIGSTKNDMGNIIYSCIHLRGKLEDAGVHMGASTATSRQVWDGVRRYNGAGPEAEAYARRIQRRYKTLLQIYK